MSNKKVTKRDQKQKKQQKRKNFLAVELQF